MKQSIRMEKGGSDMDQKASEQGWQQLQAHIEGFFGQALGNDIPRIEYKPRFIRPLLEMSSEYKKAKVRKEPHERT